MSNVTKLRLISAALMIPCYVFGMALMQEEPRRKWAVVGLMVTVHLIGYFEGRLISDLQDEPQ